MPDFATTNLDILLTFYEIFLLHITKFQFIEALNGHRLHCVEHLNIAKYAQNLVQYKPHVQNFQNFKITLTRS